MITLFDRIEFDDASQLRRTPQGFLVGTPRVARVGIQVYSGREVGRPDLERVRVYRSPEQIFSADTLRTYAHRTITNDHPPEMVDATNWKKYTVGHSGDEVVRDGIFVRVPMVLMDAAAVGDVEDGKSELSAGYTCDIDWSPGVVPAGLPEEGQAYDCAQIDVRNNHIAITDAARGGSKLRLGDEAATRECPECGKDIPASAKRCPECGYLVRDTAAAAAAGDQPSSGGKGDGHMPKTMTIDSIPVEVSDVGVAVIDRALKDRDEKARGLQDQLQTTTTAFDTYKKAAEAKDATHATTIATKDTEIATLTKKVADSETTPAKLDAMVRSRAEVVGLARSILGDKVVVDGKTEGEIRRQVVDAHVGEPAKGWNDDQVVASFASITKDAKPHEMGDAATLARHFERAPMVTNDELDKAYEDRDKELQNAWQRPAAA